MLTMEEMRLKTRGHDTLVDSTSSSPMVLFANPTSNVRRSINPNEKVNKTCFLIAQGFCRFGVHCKFLHDGVHNNPSKRPSNATVSMCNNLSSHDLVTLQNLLAKMAIQGTVHGVDNKLMSTPNNVQSSSDNKPIACFVTPPGFSNPAHYMYSTKPTNTYGGGQFVARGSQCGGGHFVVGGSHWQGVMLCWLGLNKGVRSVRSKGVLLNGVNFR